MSFGRRATIGGWCAPADQPPWVDPETGYERRAISPAAGAPLELVEVALPGGARVSYPADAYSFVGQQIWALRGRLVFREGETEHDLRAGDCLRSDCPPRAPSTTPAPDPAAISSPLPAGLPDVNLQSR